MAHHHPKNPDWTNVDWSKCWVCGTSLPTDEEFITYSMTDVVRFFDGMACRRTVSDWFNIRGAPRVREGRRWRYDMSHIIRWFMVAVAKDQEFIERFSNLLPNAGLEEE